MAVHRYLGLATFLLLLAAGLSGAILCFDKPLDRALNPDLFASARTARPLRPIDLVVRFERAHPGIVVTRFPLALAPGRTLPIDLMPAGQGGFDQLFLDPASGAPIGGRRGGPGWDRRHIVAGLYAFHYTLLAGRIGRWLMGVAALGWLVGNAIGLYLTLPVRGRFWPAWRRMWRIDFGQRPRWWLRDLHRASGLWLLLPLLTLAFTSVAMNFFDELFTPLVTLASPARPSPFDRPPPRLAQGGPRIGFASAVARAEQVARADALRWPAATASYLPDRALYGIAFTPSGEDRYRGLGPISYYLAADSGRLVYVDDPYRDSAGRKLSRALYPLHSGQVVGWPGAAIVFLLGLFTAEMSATGLYLWWKKRRARRVVRAPTALPRS